MKPTLLPHILGIIIVVSAGLLTLNYLPISSSSVEVNAALNSASNSNHSSTISKTSDFNFYDLLKDGEVIVSQSNYVSTPKNSNLNKPVFLQIAATTSEAAANKISKQLSSAGLATVQVIPRTTKNGRLFLVRTTPFNTYKELKAASTITEKLNHHPLIVEIK